jgi:hypothetical protein
MTPDKKKLWLYGGGAAALTLLVYFIFFNKSADKPAPPNPPNPPKPPKPPVEDEYYEPVVDPPAEKKIVTTRSGTRLREKPTTNSTIIKTYSSGVKLTVGDYEEMLDGTWYFITAPTRGWVRSDVVD